MTEQSLFQNALAKAPGERAAFLDVACAGNLDLRAAVETLLVAHEATDGFINRQLGEFDKTVEPDRVPGGHDATPAQTPEPNPTAIHQETTVEYQYLGEPQSNTLIAGRYTLQDKIGEGGMGEVWVARQSAPVKRKVALKLIKKGMDSRAVLQRFDQERQALAMMDHPNIAKVLDAGMTPNGQPFFVMELVKGLPLNQFCDEAKLALEERLELFVPICQAVQHAHQKGIVHRDLKPANILVTSIDGQPSPKVIDFGVAKATAGRLSDDSMVTQIGTVVGTVEYMSPEQARFSGEDIDTRADIYSLGVILYELLTGLRPIDAKKLKNAALNEMIRIIQEEEPSEPSSRLSRDDSLASLAAVRRIAPHRLLATLRGELDWVVMKCLEKQRERRYETANGLARDIQRFLADEPVEARPPSAGYRLGKLIRRNRVVVSAGAAIAAALLIGVIAFAWQAKIARAQRDLAIKAERAEAEQRQLADQQRDRAIKAEAETKARADQLEQVSDFQAAMLGRIDATQAGKLLSDDVLEKYAEALAKAGVQEAERSAQVATFAAQWKRVNVVDTAVAFLDREILKPAILAIDQKFKAQPLVDARLRAVLADRYLGLGLVNSARPLREQTLAIRRRELGDEHPGTIAALVDLGSTLSEQGKFPEAADCLRDALEKSRRVLGADHRDTLHAGLALGICLSDWGKYSEAESYIRETYEKRRRLHGEEHPQSISALNSYALALAATGKRVESEPMSRQCMELARRVLGPENPDTLDLIFNYGVTLAILKRPTEAEPYMREVLEKRRRVLGEEHFATIFAIGQLGGLMAQLGKLDQSEALLREALEKQRRIRGEEHPNAVSSRLVLGKVLARRGKLTEAEQLLREALEIARRVFGNSSVTTRSYITPLQRLLREQGKTSEAAALLSEELEITRRQQGDKHPDVLIGSAFLGGLLLEQKKMAEAVALLAPIEGEYRKAFTGSRPDQLAASLMTLGRARAELAKDPSDFALAEANLLEAHTTISQKPGDFSAVAIDCGKAIVELYAAWHKAEPGKGHDAHAAEWKKKLEAVQTPQKPVARSR
jgi:tetratricopeptide (TPR) repeat protein/tRNA A-37 threonylcarbamoyl transferase component Bud32